LTRFYLTDTLLLLKTFANVQKKIATTQEQFRFERRVLSTVQTASPVNDVVLLGRTLYNGNAVGIM